MDETKPIGPVCRLITEDEFAAADAKEDATRARRAERDYERALAQQQQRLAGQGLLEGWR